MRGVGVHVHSPVEHGGGVFADARPDHGLASRVGGNEVGDIMHHPGDGDETSTVLGLVREIVPFDDREGIQRNPPIKLGASLVEFLLALLHLAFFDFVLLELLQVVGQTQLLPNPDGPFGGIVLMPFDGVAIVGWELMMKIVVAFTQSHQRRDDVIARRVSIVKGLIAEPVGKRIDAKGRLLDEKNPKNSSIDEATPPITPEGTARHRGENETHEDDDLEVMAMLPDHDRVFVQIGDVCATNSLGVLLHQHPTKVRIQKALADRVWILVGIGIPMMGAMISGPPSDRSFHRSTADGGQKDPKGCCCRIGSMSPQSMVALKRVGRVLLASGLIPSALAFSEAKLTSSDPEACHEIVDVGEQSRLPIKWHPEGLNAPVQRHADDQGDVQPVDMLIPIGSGDG